MCTHLLSCYLRFLTHMRIHARMMISPIPYSLPLDAANSFCRLPSHREASSHTAIKTRRLTVGITRYSFIHNHALSGHLIYHNRASFVGRFLDVVSLLTPPPDGANYFRRRWRAKQIDVIFLSKIAWGTVACSELCPYVLLRHIDGRIVHGLV